METGKPVGKELRQHVRAYHVFQVNFTLEGASVVTSRMGEVQAEGKNISEGGLYMELLNRQISDRHSTAVDNFLLFKSTLVLQVQLPDESLLTARGKAVWIEKETPGQPYRHGVAVAFTQLGPEERNAIKRFVSLHS